MTFKAIIDFYLSHMQYLIISNKRPLLLTFPQIKTFFLEKFLINAPSFKRPLRKYENVKITDEDITEAAPQFTLIQEDNIYIKI